MDSRDSSSEGRALAVVSKGSGVVLYQTGGAAACFGAWLERRVAREIACFLRAHTFWDGAV